MSLLLILNMFDTLVFLKFTLRKYELADFDIFIFQ